MAQTTPATTANGSEVGTSSVTVAGSSTDVPGYRGHTHASLSRMGISHRNCGRCGRQRCAHHSGPNQGDTPQLGKPQLLFDDENGILLTKSGSAPPIMAQ